ncbi:hypothetical protein CDAR_312051 [Caerostris darwini]|uniref:Uncharacterized protein n=1 Tax=Caerostris darwini TaxID=1538125 RepID=A0AAV4S902_9ARAC|nr:hypothetical protein CDAR_312051 [Caerostris darwini]
MVHHFENRIKIDSLEDYCLIIQPPRIVSQAIAKLVRRSPSAMVGHSQKCHQILLNRQFIYQKDSLAKPVAKPPNSRHFNSSLDSSQKRWRDFSGSNRKDSHLCVLICACVYAAANL